MKRVSGAILVTSLIAMSAHGASRSTSAGPTFHYLVPLNNLGLLNKSLRPKTLARNSKFAVVEMSQKQVEALSEKVHKTRNTCGGFMVVENENKSATAEQILKSEMVRLEQPEPQEVYTIKNRESVRKVFEKLQTPRFSEFFRDLTNFPNRFANGSFGTQAANWLKDKAEAYALQAGATNVTTYFVTTNGYTQPSTVVKVAGADQSLPAVVMGGHMDSYNGNRPGADDDGSGTASVMEIYRSILDSGVKFKRDIYFIFYAAEEWGLHGSIATVKDFRVKNIQVRAAVQLDMTGYKSPNDTGGMYFVSDNVHGGLTDFAILLAREYLGIANPMKTQCGYACSDHASWHRGGVPAVFPFEASVANYNRKLHTDQDSFDTINIEHAMKYVRVSGALVTELADPL